ncbi:MAG: hypothetical protein J6D02_10990 [Lachnospira sp.]|nr:hypothetical protein [Lachnospira sp.]
MEYTSRRNGTYRCGIRCIGVVFVIGAVAIIYHNIHSGITGLGAIGMAIALVFLLVGVAYVKQSFGISAYDLTYHILPEHLKLMTHRGEIIIRYEDITSVTINQPKVDMDYYMIHLLAGKYNLVMHVENAGELANQMYDALIQYTEQTKDEKEA